MLTEGQAQTHPGTCPIKSGSENAAFHSFE
jgi:hypothetical protein